MARQHVRRLTLHQHQSQELLKQVRYLSPTCSVLQLTRYQAGAVVPRGLVARSAEEARAAVEELGKLAEPES